MSKKVKCSSESVSQFEKGDIIIVPSIIMVVDLNTDCFSIK
jgi:hypothetical protein